MSELSLLISWTLALDLGHDGEGAAGLDGGRAQAQRRVQDAVLVDGDELRMAQPRCELGLLREEALPS